MKDKKPFKIFIDNSKNKPRYTLLLLDHTVFREFTEQEILHECETLYNAAYNIGYKCASRSKLSEPILKNVYFTDEHIDDPESESCLLYYIDTPIRRFSTALISHYELRLIVEDLNNIYYTGYAHRIAELKTTAPEDFSLSM